MTTIAEAPAAELARAIYVGSLSWAMARGAAPSVLEARLRQAAGRADVSLKPSLSLAEALAAVEQARGLLGRPDETDADILELRATVALALEEISGRPALYQSMTVLLVGSGLILALAVLGKLKVKDGKWELVEGLPGFEHVAKLFPGIFLG